MQNLAIFGAGQIGKQTKKLVEEKYFDEYRLVYFVDNNSDKQGSLIEGIPTISAEKLLEVYEKEIDCVASALQKSYEVNDFLIQHRIIPIKITSIGIYPLVNKIEKTERFCPICQKTSSYFDLFGVKPRQDALCPHCGSLERHRLLYLFLREKMNFFNEDSKHRKMLHIAPENCLKELFEKQFCENYITADLYATNVKVKMDIMDIQYEDETFDIIYCSHVLEHVSDDRKAMKEFFRVLKKDGWAILNVPIIRDKTYEDPSIVDPEEREKIFGQSDHVRAYGFDYVDRLRDSGFSVKVICAKDFLEEAEIEKTGLCNGGSIYFCSVSKNSSLL
jgi:predicted SAM-dependent methyltransferase